MGAVVKTARRFTQRSNKSRQQDSMYKGPITYCASYVVLRKHDDSEMSLPSYSLRHHCTQRRRRRVRYARPTETNFRTKWRVVQMSRLHYHYRTVLRQLLVLCCAILHYCCTVQSACAALQYGTIAAVSFCTYCR